MTSPTNPIAAVTGAASPSLQALFQHMVESWRASGVQVVGLIEQTHGLPSRTCNAGILHDIASGSPYAIFLESAPQSSACQIDVVGAETASKALLPQIQMSDLVVLSKFGKLEAARRGLIGAFEAAIKLRKPILTTVSDRHLRAWREFAPAASELEPSPRAIADWWASMGSQASPSHPSDGHRAGIG
jgi:nucleoside-triphosphatase THEP1